MARFRACMLTTFGSWFGTALFTFFTVYSRLKNHQNIRERFCFEINSSIYGLCDGFYTNSSRQNEMLKKALKKSTKVLVNEIFYLPSYHQVLVERHGMNMNTYDLHKATICHKGDDSSMALPCDKAIYMSHAFL